jgi:hypothetical protein
VASRLNALGLRDTFAPVQRLRAEADGQIRAAEESADKLASQLDQAEALMG